MYDVKLKLEELCKRRWYGKKVEVCLRDRRSARGQLYGIDEYLNIALIDAEFEGRRYRWLLIRGSSVQCVKELKYK